LLVLRTFSKAYGLAALRVGYVVGAPELIDYLNRMRAPFNVNALAQRAALVALGDPAHVSKYVALNRVERARVAERLEALGLAVAPSQANFLLVDVRPRGFTGAQVYDALLSKGVIVRPMPPPLEGFVRITIGLETWNDRLLEAATEVCGG
jgi:histidinol-phosphate aminotransferase